MKCYYITEVQEIPPKPQLLPLDIETYNLQGMTALDPITSSISLIQVEINGDLYVYDIIRIGHVPDFLVDWLEDGTVIKIVHNISFEYKMFLSAENIALQGYWCTMLAETVLKNGLDVRYGIAPVVKRRCGVDLPKEEGKSDWGVRPLTKSQLLYAFNDIRYLKNVFQEQCKEFKGKDKLFNVYKRELKYVPMFCDTELAGVYFNKDKVQKAYDEYVKKVEEGLKAIQKVLPPVPVPLSTLKTKKGREKYPDGVRPPENTNDFKKALNQLGVPVPKVVDKKTKKERESLAKQTYHLVKHPSGKLMSQWAKDKKLLTSYLEPLLGVSEKKSKWIHKVTGLAHPSILQNGTQTGRPAYQNPPLQTIPAIFLFRDMVEPNE